MTSDASPLRPTLAGDRRSLAGIPKLGVGVLFNTTLSELLKDDLDAIDYLAIIPEAFWSDRGLGASPRYVEIPHLVQLLDWVASRRPIVCHSIGLSLGSAEFFDSQHIDQLASWHRNYRFPWISDHLSYTRSLDEDGKDFEIGVALPVPYDDDVLDMVTARVCDIQSRIPLVFLLENNVYYIQIPDQDMSETEFFNTLTKRTTCGMLLDLHNVYTNARNHAFSPTDFVDELDLTRVIEVHIAGGEDFADMYTDAHSGPCPEEVWQLLDYVLARAPNLCAVTFEFHQSAYPRLKSEGVLAQLETARSIWDRHR